MNNKFDQYEEFLAGQMTLQRFCEQSGFDEISSPLANVLFGLQEAHNQIVARESKKLTLAIIRACQTGRLGKGKRITDHQLGRLLGLTGKEMKALDQLRIARPADPPGAQNRPTGGRPSEEVPKG